MTGRMLHISWRSILRNRRRTIITGAAIGLGLASLIFTETLYAGMMEHMVHAGTDTWSGHGQIHGDGFRETARIGMTVTDPVEVLQALSEDTLVTASTGRLIAPASLESAREMKPVTLIGVDRETDPAVTLLDQSIIEGEYLTEDSTGLIIGEKLAEDMELRLGDIAVVTAAMADSGFGGGMFIVSGICRFGSEELDRATAFVNIGAAGSLLGLQGSVHEIAVRFSDPMVAENGDMEFWTRYTENGNEAVGWPVYAPEIHSMVQMVNVSVMIMALILFGLVLFGILNSLFMSVYERMYEFGVMKAVGTRKGVIAGLVLLEAFWLGAAGVIIGSLLGWAVTAWFAETGLSFGDFDFSGIMFDKPIYPALDWSRLWYYPVATLLFTIAAGIYPGIHAGNLNPSKAIRKSL